MTTITPELPLGTRIRKTFYGLMTTLILVGLLSGLLVEIISIGVGFIGVIWTLKHNADLARKAQESQWEHEEETRRKELERERYSMRSVLSEELKTLEIITAGPIKKMEADPTVILTANVELDLDESFQSLASSIGWLSRLEVEKIPLAYHLRRAAAGKLKLFGEPHGAFNSHVKVGSEHFPDLIEEKKKALGGIKIAIAAMEDKGLCRSCGKEDSEVRGPKDPTDDTCTFQILCEPCFDELKKSKNLTESEATT